MMRINRSILMVIVIMLCVFIFSGCNAKKSNKSVVAFIPQVKDAGEYWDDISDNLKNKLEASGFMFETDAAEKWSGDLQAEVINKFIDKKVDAIIIAPTGTSELFKSFQRAKEAGIKIILIDTDIDSEYLRSYGTEVTSFVGVDNYKCGREVGEEVSKKLDKNSEIAVFSGRVESDNSEDRCNGFCDAVSAKGMNVVVRNSVPSWAEDEGYLKAKQIFKSYPNIKGVFAADKNICKGVYRAADECNVNIIGGSFDSNNDMIKKIESGKVICTLDQDNSVMSNKVCEVVKMSVEGKNVDRVTNYDGKIIKK